MEEPLTAGIAAREVLLFKGRFCRFRQSPLAGRHGEQIPLGSSARRNEKYTIYSVKEKLAEINQGVTWPVQVKALAVHRRCRQL